MDADAAEPLGKSGRPRDIDEQHEAVFLDRGMIPSGDEVQKGTMTDDIGNAEAEVHRDRNQRRIDEAEPESLTAIVERQTHDQFTRLKYLDQHDECRIDRTSHEEIGREREIAEPVPQRPIQDE